MFQNRKITFIGPGVMAEAMIAGLIRQEVASADSLQASGPRLERVEKLRDEYGIHPFSDNVLAAQDADVVVLSVKPQSLEKILFELRGAVQPSALVLSIIAGAPIGKIAGGLGHKSIVRAMPNTPAQIGQGITVWTAAPPVSDEQREMSRRILGALGEEVFMEEETYLDMATALSGTGPAYVFMFMEAMVDAGVHLGFPGASPNSWSSRRCADRWIFTARPPSTWRASATRSPRRAGPRPPRCIIWRKRGSGRPFPGPSGLPTNARESSARTPPRTRPSGQGQPNKRAGRSPCSGGALCFYRPTFYGSHFVNCWTNHTLSGMIWKLKKEGRRLFQARSAPLFLNL